MIYILVFFGAWFACAWLDNQTSAVDEKWKKILERRND